MKTIGVKKSKRQRIARNILKDNRDEIEMRNVSSTTVIENIIHETMNYTRHRDGIYSKGGSNNKIENNQYYWQRN